MVQLYSAYNLSRRYGDSIAVKSCTFSIREGDLICLVGPNGAGKTSLLEMLAFLSPPSEGELYFRGTRIINLVPRKISDQVTLVLQKPYLFNGTVRTNIDVVLKSRGLLLSERKRRLDYALGALNICDLADHSAKTLSSGYAQRVAIARALALRTPVLLFDEPTANLDEEHVLIFHRLISKLNREEGVTVVIATHDLCVAKSFCSSIWHMNNGRIIPSLTIPDPVEIS